MTAWVELRKWSGAHGPDWSTLGGDIYFWCSACQKWHRDYCLEDSTRKAEEKL